jgi:NAD(P)-dependent dehydrogenase (short-subunit alcohol dehydrogenase family)
MIIAGRSALKLQQAQENIQQSAPDTPVRQLILDLGSLAAVRRATAEVNSWLDVSSIDILINNAGIMARPFELTEDGIESQFATNHLGHFLFTQLIMTKVLAAGRGARIVNLSSNSYKGGGVRWDDWNFEVGGNQSFNG